MVLWCLWGKRNAIWLKMQICERSSNSLICWINQQKATSLKERNIHRMKRWCLHSIWNTFLKIHKITQLFSVWEITNGNWTVALQALSKCNVSLVSKGSLPILSVSCCCSYLSPTSTFSLLAIWYHSFSAPSSAAHWALPQPHLTHWYRRNLLSQDWEVLTILSH